MARNATGPIECITSAVTSNFKYKRHIFGQQEATFNGLTITDDMMVIARLYLRPAGDNSVDTELTDEKDTVTPGKTLVAWGVLPLTKGKLFNQSFAEYLSMCHCMTHRQTYTHMHMYSHAHTSTCMRTHTHIHMHAHARTHTHTHTHTHTLTVVDFCYVFLT